MKGRTVCAGAHWQGCRDVTCRLIRRGEGTIAAVEAAVCLRATTEAQVLGVGGQK